MSRRRHELLERHVGLAGLTRHGELILTSHASNVRHHGVVLVVNHLEALLRLVLLAVAPRMAWKSAEVARALIEGNLRLRAVLDQVLGGSAVHAAHRPGLSIAASLTGSSRARDSSSPSAGAPVLVPELLHDGADHFFEISS